MIKHRQYISGHLTARAAALVENHSLLATLLAAVCLTFAINLFLTGPGSDGGSGFGGTGKLPGESGFGGTGKSPNDGSGLKLGANDSDHDKDTLTPLEILRSQLKLDGAMDASSPTQIASLAATPIPDFDISVLRFSPEMPLTTFTILDNTEQVVINELVASVNLDVSENQINAILKSDRGDVAADTLVASLDILNILIVAETEAALQVNETILADSSTSDVTIRHRVAVPIRPERPDRFVIPTRIAPIQRVDVIKPPPVRPMRTLSTLLSH